MAIANGRPTKTAPRPRSSTARASRPLRPAARAVTMRESRSTRLYALRCQRARGASRRRRESWMLAGCGSSRFCAFPTAWSCSSSASSPTADMPEEGYYSHVDRRRNRAQKSRPNRLRGKPASLGRRTVLRLDWTQLETGKGLRGHHRLRTHLPLRRIHHAARGRIARAHDFRNQL